jgi:hypothetical protein
MNFSTIRVTIRYIVSILLSVCIFEKVFKSLFVTTSLILFNHEKAQVINCSLKLKNILTLPLKQKQCSYRIVSLGLVGQFISKILKKNE